MSLTGIYGTVTLRAHGGHLLLEREEKKRYERKLLDLMSCVKDERGFGFYQCPSCKRRWRSGFTYQQAPNERR